MEPSKIGEQHSIWLDDHTLKSLHDINARCIDLLIKLARGTEDTGIQQNSVSGLRRELLALNSAEKQRIANIPFLLVSLAFNDLQWWLKPFSRIRERELTSGWLTNFPRTTSVKFARATLMLAWHTGQINRDYALIFLGINPAVSEIIAKLSLHEMDHIAERYFHHLTPRWDGRLSIWKHLLGATPYSYIENRNNLNTHYLQLIGGKVKE